MERKTLFGRSTSEAFVNMFRKTLVFSRGITSRESNKVRQSCAAIDQRFLYLRDMHLTVPTRGHHVCWAAEPCFER